MTLANNPKNQNSEEGRLTVQMFLQPNHEGTDTMKSWTYAEITKEAEIKNLMQEARDAEKKGTVTDKKCTEHGQPGYISCGTD